MERLSVLVFGAGAIGTYVGGSLALSGHQVVFLERPGVAAGLQESGLRLTLHTAEDAAITIPPSSFAVAGSLPEALHQGSFDFAIFALKSFDTASVLADMRPFAEQMPPILCLSNGVDNEPELAAVLGTGKVIAGTVTSSVARAAAGEIRLERLRGVGVADGHPLSLLLWQALNEASLRARLFPRPLDMKWSKMLTNLMVNSTVAILDMPPQAVLAHPGMFRLEIAILREALRVMRAQGIRVVDLPGTPVRLLALAAALPAFISRPLMVRAVGGGRGGKMPSFHIDLHAGRGKSEVEWLNGAVARYGEKFGVRAPVNRRIADLLSALTRGDIPLETYRLQPDKLLDEVRERS